MNLTQAQLAQDRHTKMLIQESRATNCSVKNSEIYSIDFKQTLEKGNPKHIFVNLDSVSVLRALNNLDDTCLLNFASYKKPGGGYLNGSIAQEESLCYESNLYEVLSNEKFEPFYKWNNKNTNSNLYLNRAIYSKRIKFEGNFYCDVLSCAAPNIGFLNNFQKNQIQKVNYEALKSRCQFIADILNKQNVKTFVTGAFGCGVFGQDPKEVAKVWKELSWGKVEKVLYGVPGQNINTLTFRNQFS